MGFVYIGVFHVWVGVMIRAALGGGARGTGKRCAKTNYQEWQLAHGDPGWSLSYSRAILIYGYWDKSCRSAKGTSP